MANTKISVRIYGNPISNAGFEPIVVLNNPPFPELTYLGVPGTDKSAPYYVLYTGSDYTQYTTVMENVRSAGASRGGMLKISIGLPKGYALYDEKKSPYDVLVALSDMFLGKYMIKGGDNTYQFVPNIPTGSVKSDTQSIIDQFEVHSVDTPWRPMAGTSQAIYCCPESKMADLMKDIQFIKFSEYKEIVVAETPKDFKGDNLTAYVEVPRKPMWMVVAGQSRYPLKNGEPLTLSSCKVLGLDPDCYQDTEEVFDLDKILAGDFPTNTTSDIHNETVKWNPPKVERKVDLTVKINGGDNYLEYRKIDLKIGNTKISPTSANYTTYLKGNDIKGTPSVSYSGDGYKLLSPNPTLTRNQEGQLILTINFEKIQKTQSYAGSLGGGPSTTASATSKIVITDITKSLLTLYNDNWEIYRDDIQSDSGLKVRVRYGANILQQIKPFIFSPKQDKVEVSLPADWLSPLTVELPQLKKSKSVTIKNGKPIELRLDAFTSPMEKESGKGNRYIQWILFLLLGMAVGVVGGHFLWPTTTSGKIVPPPIEEKKEKGSQPQQDPEILKKIESYKSTLASDDLTFDEVDNIYLKYSEYKDIDKEFATMVMEYIGITGTIKGDSNYRVFASKIGIDGGTSKPGFFSRIHQNHLDMMRKPFLITKHITAQTVNQSVRNYENPKIRLQIMSFKDFEKLLPQGQQTQTSSTKTPSTSSVQGVVFDPTQMPNG